MSRPGSETPKDDGGFCVFPGESSKLPGEDSNLDKENQNLLCYRYTTGYQMHE